MQRWLIFLAAFFIFILFFWKKFPAMLGFFDGIFLAFLCFCFLPLLLEGQYFWINSVLLVLGVLGSSFLEQKTNNFYYGSKKYGLFHCVIFLAAVLFFLLKQQNCISFPFSILSGLFLLVACGGILPEECSTREKITLAILGIFGFLIGILLIFPI